MIGGGLAGLTAAATLARAGRTVTVVEGAEHLGGRARSRHRAGFDLNLGPHALYRTVRRSRRAASPRCPRSRAAGRGSSGPACSSVASMVPAAATSGGTSATVSASLKAMTGLGVRASAEWTGRPVAEWIDSVTDDPAGRAAIASVVRTATYSADPSLLDAGAATAQLRAAAAHGVLYLHHGWSSLVDGLASVIRSRGGEIMTGCRVEAVEHDDRVRAVRLADGRTLATSRRR